VRKGDPRHAFGPVEDNLVHIINPECLCGAGAGRGIVEGIEDIDWHDTAPLIVSLAESVDRESSAGIKLA
jgi:hypothetical protein